MRLLLATLVATRAAPRRAQVTLEMMVHFASRGWMKVPGLAPELADVAVEGALDRALESTLRDYANYSLFYLRDKKYIAVESHDHFEACGALSFSDLDASGGAYRFLDRLQCSVRVERALDPRSALSLPYFQGLNAHRREPRLRAVVEDAALGAFAASLLQSPRVRLYQSALFVKDPAHFNNATGWHRDLQFCPVDVAGGGLVTFWCPYGRPLEGGDATLVFATGSHRDVGFERWYGDAPEAVDAVLLKDLAALGGRHDRRRRRLALQDDVDEAVDGALLRLLDRARPEARVVGGIVVIDDRVFGVPDPRIAAEDSEGARRRAHQRSIAAIG